jgi:hypothetical protein
MLNWKECGRNRPWAFQCTFPAIPGEIAKNHKSLTQGSRCHGRDSNQAPQKYVGSVTAWAKLIMYCFEKRSFGRTRIWEDDIKMIYLYFEERTWVELSEDYI